MKRPPATSEVCTPETDPNSVEALLRQGILAARRGLVGRAEQLFLAALDRDSDCVEALNWLASFRRAAKRQQDAIELCRRALKVEPKNAQLLFGLAQCYLDTWRNDLAIEVLERLIAIDPRAALAFDRLGVALRREGRFVESAEAFRSALEKAPAMLASYINLAAVLRLNPEHEAEADSLDAHAIRLAEESGPKSVELARAYLDVGDADRAEAAVRAAIKLSPFEEFPRAMLGRILQASGKFAESAAVLQDAIRAHPDSAPMYFDWAHGGRARREDAEFVDGMKALLHRPGLSAEDRGRLHFALGKVYDDFGEYGKALLHFDEANRATQERLPPSADNRRALAEGIDAVIRTFTPELFESHHGRGSNSGIPIFIAGMIRSGTTLTEQIVSSHPLVGGAGELHYLPDHAQEVFEPKSGFHPEGLRRLADGYLSRLCGEAPNSPRIADKMPANVLFAGLAYLMFPQAHMIITRREALDNCLSVYVTPNEIPEALTNSAADIAFSYGEHRRLVDHWQAVLPGSWLTILNYEELVANTESEVRRIIEFLGLPWDAGCLAHHKNVRSVTTPSQWQVRQQIYATSVGRWRNYEPWIAELRRFLA